MAVNLNRWLNYAKAKLDSSVASGNEELDRLEAKRQTETASKPWLVATGDAPTVDEAAARIRWEAEQATQAATAPAASATAPPAPATPAAATPAPAPAPAPSAAT